MTTLVETEGDVACAHIFRSGTAAIAGECVRFHSARVEDDTTASAGRRAADFQASPPTPETPMALLARYTADARQELSKKRALTSTSRLPPIPKPSQHDMRQRYATAKPPVRRSASNGVLRVSQRSDDVSVR